MKNSILLAAALASLVLSARPAIGAQLYQNGQILTALGAGYGGADVSVVQDPASTSTNSVAVTGWHNDVRKTNRLADDFTVPAGGWHLGRVKLYGYQTYAGTVSTITNAYLQIWDGCPTNPASSVVWGDLVTGRLTNSTWTHAYRVLPDEVDSTRRAIMEVVADVDVTLPAGTYWLDFMLSGVTTNGPYCPPVGTNDPCTGNALAFRNDAWQEVTNTLGQGLDFPFVLEAAEAPAWGEIAALPVAVSGAASAVVDQNFYVIGGSESPYALQVLNLNSGAWSVDTNIVATPVSHAGAVALGTDIYVIGGDDLNLTDAPLHVLHTATGTWETLATDPLPRNPAGVGCAVLGGKIYAFGGEFDTATFCYDPAASAGSRWTTLSNAPAPLMNASVVALAGKLYVGASTASQGREVFVYDPAQDSWEQLPLLHYRQAGGKLWAQDGLLHVGGGAGGYVVNYDPADGTNGTWYSAASLPASRQLFVFAQTDGTNRWFAGGLDDTGIASAVAAASPAGSATTTTTTLDSAPNPSSAGQDVVLTATVSPAAATGTVTFKDGATTLGTGTLSGGTATLTNSALSVGSHSLTAEYAGDSTYTGSTNSPALTHTVSASAPVLSTPTVGNVGANQVTLHFTSSATGTGYFTIQAGSSVACGTGTQVKAGQTSAGLPALRRGSLPLIAATAGDYTLRNLTEGTTYTVCFTAESGGVLQATPATANFTTAAATSRSTPAWDALGNAGFSADQAEYTSLAFAPDGTPYVAFMDYGYSSKVSVMKYDGSAWVSVGSPGFSAGLVNYVALAFAPDGSPFVAYQDSSDGQKATVMRYTGIGPSGWELVGSGGLSAGVAVFISLAFAPDGSPYVAYSDSSSAWLSTVRKFNGTDWVDVGSPGFSAAYAYEISLAFAPDGSPCVAYRDGDTTPPTGSSGKATVMRFNGSAWEPMGSAGFSVDVAYNPSLAFAQDGTAYVAYQDGDPAYATDPPTPPTGNGGKATVMKFNGSAWEAVGSPGFSAGVISFPSLVFVPDGKPVVAFDDTGATVMKHTGSGASGWDVVGSARFSADAAIYTSMAVDPSGIPYVAYEDFGYSGKATVMKLKETPAITTMPTASPITYGQTLASSALTGGAASTAGTFAWTTPGTAPNAGTPSPSVTFTPSDTANFITTSFTVNVTVNKATPTATLAVNNSPVTYDGTAKSATVGVSSSSTPGAAANILTGGAASQTAAGTYAVTADFVPTDTANYGTLTGLAAGNFVINKATPTATLAVNNSPVTYDGTAKSATVGVSSSSTPGAAANILTGGAASQTAAGTYAVTADFVPTDTNYNTLTGLSAGSFVIAQATPGVTSWPTASDITQGQALSASSLTGGSASVAGSFGWEAPSTVPPVGTNSQSAIFSPTDGANYLAVTGSVTVVVNPAGPVTRQPVQSGPWDDPATWGGTLPGAGDDVVVPPGITVTVGVNPPAVRNLTILGTLTVPGTQTIQITGNFTNAGTFNPGQGTVEFAGSGDSTLTATAPGTLTFYRLTINKDNTADKVTALSKVKATKKLTVTRGKYATASDYLDIFIDAGGELILSNPITVGGNFTNAGTFTHNNHGVTFDGGTVQNLSLQVMTWFYDLTVSAGTTLVETETDDNAIVENTLANLGVLRKSQAVAGLTQYYFGLAGRYNSADLELDITSLTGGDPLTAVQVDRRDTNPPNPPGTNVTGLYWVITPTGSDFVANLTLPHQGWDDPLACRYTGSGWDAVQTSFTPNTVVRAGVTQLSPWAVFGSTNVTETVDGYVYKDSLLSGTVGQYDAGIDTPLPNVTVHVTNSVGAVVTLSTDGGGYFQAGVPAGVTRILVDQSDPDFPTGLGLTSNSHGQGANPASVTVPSGGTASKNVGYLRNSPTLGSLVSVTARAVRGLTTVEWVTVSELGTVAYDLQRRAPDGGWLTVNADPVFAWNAINGASYTVSDAGARARQTYHYRIMESLDNGMVWAHGPYAVLVTGEPGEPVRLTVAMQADGRLALSWAGESGTNYLLERADSLGAGAVWTEVALPTSEATTITLPAGSGASFFRLYRLP